jgi:hypothetical protein
MKANGTHEKRNHNPAARSIRSKQGVASQVERGVEHADAPDERRAASPSAARG